MVTNRAESEIISIDAIPEHRSERTSAFPLAAVGIIAVSAILHLYLAFHYPLAPDETYYWEWSRRPAWGYYDQGPMIAWWIRAGCALFGETQLGVRIGIVAAAAITQGFFYLLFRDVAGAATGTRALLLISITPIALIGGFVATYDPLMILFWSAAMYFGWRAIHGTGLAAWNAAGISIGLGLLSKHTTILFMPCLLIALLHAENRHWLRRLQPYAAAALALLVFAPNLIWQSRHGWVTFTHLFVLTGKGTDHGVGHRLGEYIASQAGLQTPLLFLAFIGAIVWAGSKVQRKDPRSWYLFSMSAPVLTFFLLMTLKSRVQANWAIAGWLTPPLLLLMWQQGTQSEGKRRALTVFSNIGFAFCGLLSLAFAFPEFRTAVGVQTPMKWDAQVNKLYGGRELAAAIMAERERMAAPDRTSAKFCAATYDTASRMAFNLPGNPWVRCLFLETRANSYQLWDGLSPLQSGDNALVADGLEWSDEHRPRFEAIFERVEPVAEPVLIYRRGIYAEPVQKYYLYRCYGYHPNPSIERAQGG